MTAKVVKKSAKVARKDLVFVLVLFSYSGPIS